MATLVPVFLIPAASTYYLDLFVRSVKSLFILPEAQPASVSGVNLTLYDGVGYTDSLLNTSASVAFPYMIHNGSTGTPTVPVFDLKGTAYTMSSISGNKQSMSIFVDRKEGGDWLRLKIQNTDTSNSMPFVLYGKAE